MNKPQKTTWFEEHQAALTEAVTLFLLLFLFICFTILFLDISFFSETSIKLAFLVTAALACGLLARRVFDIRTFEQANELKVTTLHTDGSSNTLFHQVYNNSPVPYIIINQDGKVLSANVAAVRLLGMTQTTVIDVDMFSRLVSETEIHVQLLIEKFQNNIALSNEEIQISNVSNESFSWVLLSLYPFNDAEGLPVGLLTLVDITKQKKIENAKTEFVSLASHQLRTPIAGMRWSAELLLMDNPDVLSHRQKKYIDRMLESVERMNTLVDDFLRVSRFELGTFVAESTVVSWPSILSEVLTDQAAVIRNKQLTVDVTMAPELYQLSTDPNLIRMIATNLLGNAIKYTSRQGSITVAGEVSGEEYMITITDTGMGIPIDDQDQIFQKLFRATNATREVPDGTGLGLYIVREAVRVLRGRISFTSTEGIGTTFTVVLPLTPLFESATPLE